MLLLWFASALAIDAKQAVAETSTTVANDDQFQPLFVARFLSLEAEMGVNIDSQGQQQAEEALQIPPHPNIFLAQQQQVGFASL